MDGPLFIISPMCYTMVSNLKEDEMSISLAGATQAQEDCNPHHWDIVGIHEINPDTGKVYGNRTKGTCRKCKLERMFSSAQIQHKKGDWTLSEKPPE